MESKSSSPSHFIPKRTKELPSFFTKKTCKPRGCVNCAAREESNIQSTDSGNSHKSKVKVKVTKVTGAYLFTMKESIFNQRTFKTRMRHKRTMVAQHHPEKLNSRKVRVRGIMSLQLALTSKFSVNMCSLVPSLWRVKMPS